MLVDSLATVTLALLRECYERTRARNTKPLLLLREFQTALGEFKTWDVDDAADALSKAHSRRDLAQHVARLRDALTGPDAPEDAPPAHEVLRASCILAARRVYPRPFLLYHALPPGQTVASAADVADIVQEVARAALEDAGLAVDEDSDVEEDEIEADDGDIEEPEDAAIDDGDNEENEDADAAVDEGDIEEPEVAAIDDRDVEENEDADAAVDDGDNEENEDADEHKDNIEVEENADDVDDLGSGAEGGAEESEGTESGGEESDVIHVEPLIVSAFQSVRAAQPAQPSGREANIKRLVLKTQQQQSHAPLLPASARAGAPAPARRRRAAPPAADAFF